MSAKPFSLGSNVTQLMITLNSLSAGLNSDIVNIQSLLDNLAKMKLLGFDTSQTFLSLEGQKDRTVERFISVNETNTKFINGIYAILYSNLLSLSEFNITIMEEPDAITGSLIVSFFGGYTDDDNIPKSGGHYRKYPNIRNVNYTFDNCTELAGLLSDLATKLRAKTVAIETILSKVSINTTNGFSIGGLAAALTTARTNITNAIATRAASFTTDINGLVTSTTAAIQPIQTVDAAVSTAVDLLAP